MDVLVEGAGVVAAEGGEDAPEVADAHAGGDEVVEDVLEAGGVGVVVVGGVGEGDAGGAGGEDLLEELEEAVAAEGAAAPAAGADGDGAVRGRVGARG